MSRQGGDRMLCDRCKKREAKIYYTEVVNGEMKEQHLCEECAAECTRFHINSTFINKDMSVGDILSSILGKYRNSSSAKEDVKTESDAKTASKDKSKEPVLKCDKCQMTYDQFLQEGKFGCAECYHSFHKILIRSLKNLQGTDTHVGKKPKGYVSSTNKIINELSDIEKKSILLQEAIEKEEFEEAARLRDEIRALRDKKEHPDCQEKSNLVVDREGSNNA